MNSVQHYTRIRAAQHGLVIMTGGGGGGGGQNKARARCKRVHRAKYSQTLNSLAPCHY